LAGGDQNHGPTVLGRELSVRTGDGCPAAVEAGRAGESGRARLPQENRPGEEQTRRESRPESREKTGRRGENPAKEGKTSPEREGFCLSQGYRPDDSQNVPEGKARSQTGCEDEKTGRFPEGEILRFGQKGSRQSGCAALLEGEETGREKEVVRMTLHAVYFDLGGVLVRTEDHAPRSQLAESLGLTESELEKEVFVNESSAQASVGVISSDQHWKIVAQNLNLPEADIPRVRDGFFAGDLLDTELVDFLRALRKSSIRVGLISNAWSDLREWIAARHFEDAFDEMIISSEVGLAKPDARIYRMALEKLGVAASEAVFVDDMPANVEGAQAVGMQAFQFTQSREVVEQIRRLLADPR